MFLGCVLGVLGVGNLEPLAAPAPGLGSLLLAASISLWLGTGELERDPPLDRQHPEADLWILLPFIGEFNPPFLKPCPLGDLTGELEGEMELEGLNAPPAGSGGGLAFVRQYSLDGRRDLAKVGKAQLNHGGRGQGRTSRG